MDIPQKGQDVKRLFLAKAYHSFASAPVVHTGKTVDAAFLTRLMKYRESTQPLRSGPRGIEDTERALAQAGGKITRAAEILGVHRATLWRKCKRLSQAKNR